MAEGLHVEADGVVVEVVAEAVGHGRGDDHIDLRAGHLGDARLRGVEEPHVELDDVRGRVDERAGFVYRLF